MPQKAKGHRPGDTETSDKLSSTFYALMDHQHYVLTDFPTVLWCYKVCGTDRPGVTETSDKLSSTLNTLMDFPAVSGCYRVCRTESQGT